MLNRCTTKWLALLGSVILTTSVALAQDNKTLIDVLVKKGILTDQEADDVRADLAKENSAVLVSTSKSPNLEKLTISGRFQSQFVDLASDPGSSVAKPAATKHFLLRRIYIGAKAQFSSAWSGTFNYDFANLSFDQAFITWAPNPWYVTDVGFRKVPFGYDEWSISSGALKCIERSAITRFFVEANNGRRLGAGSYRQGVFVGGADPSPLGGFSYNVAVTNPERDEFSTGSSGTNPNTGGTQGNGSSINNNFAYWANVGYSRKFGEGLLNVWKAGVSGGWLPDQGGSGNPAAVPNTSTLGKGYDITVFSAYADLYYGPWSLVAEYYWAKDRKGVSLTRDSEPKGYWIQPSYRFGAFEPVFRYSHVFSDGRGIMPGDLERSAPNPTGLTFDKMDEYYAGVTWYLLGNDQKHEVQLQAGYIYAVAKNRLAGATTVSEVKTQGLRSQLQVNF
jgi:phosphate-selective porin